MVVSVLFNIILFCGVALGSRVAPLVTVNSATGDYAVIIDGETWLSSSYVYLQANNKMYSTKDKSLQFQNVIHSSGQDNLGKFVSSTLSWTNDADKLTMKGVIKQYGDFIVFEQVFDVALQGTSTGNADILVSSFPSFSLDDNDGGDGYAHWISWYYEDTSTVTSRPSVGLVAPGYPTPTFGVWGSNTTLPGGIGGSGILAVFNKENTISVVLSPMNNFMVASQLSPSAGILEFGISGNITSIPKHFRLQTILSASRGINNAMRRWGEILRTNYNKQDFTTSKAKDITLQYLGYTTDNGAYYYYNTVPGMNYQETIFAIKDYADSLELPYKYILLDSWWYYKGSNGGIANWTARPDIFPDGMSAIYDYTGWLVQAHNRYWSIDNHYSMSNGGSYLFLDDYIKNGTVPLEQAFWDDLLGNKESWGLRVYEQDWLFNEFYQYVSAMLEDVSLGRTWLLQMGTAAEKHGLTIQYCMPYVRHLLQSLEIPAVTQARASDDYKPGEDLDQWKIGGQSILIEALGLAPSKDGYWTTTYQDGNPYGDDHTEPAPRMQSAVITLSSGPVAVADAIDLSDAELIMRSCRKDGLLLQPSYPAKMIDGVFLQSALGGNIGPAGEVWFAESNIGDRKYGYVFAAALDSDWMLTPSDIGLSGMFWAFEANHTDVLIPFSATQPIQLKACDTTDFQLWTILPREHSGAAVQGEVNKWVSISPSRVSSIIAENDNILVEIAGSSGETVQFGFVDGNGKQIIVDCTFPSVDSGMEHLRMTVTSSGECF